MLFEAPPADVKTHMNAVVESDQYRDNKLLNIDKPVLGFAAYSGTGKTSLLIKLLPLMKLQGVRIGMIKHAHHDFNIDIPGKDSYKLRQAGAEQMLIASDKRWALMTEVDSQQDVSLSDLINKLDLTNLDLILVEGFRQLPFPKIELHRPSTGKDLIFPDDDNIIAVASDETLKTGKLPLLNINQPEEIAGFINRWLAS